MDRRPSITCSVVTEIIRRKLEARWRPRLGLLTPVSVGTRSSSAANGNAIESEWTDKKRVREAGEAAAMRGLRLLEYGIGTIFSSGIYVGRATPGGALCLVYARVRGRNFIKQPSSGKRVAIILHRRRVSSG